MKNFNKNCSSKGVAILSIAGVISKLMSLLYVPLLILILNDNYGIYTSTYDIFVFIYAITNVGMQPAIGKLIAEYDALGRHKDALRTFKISKHLLGAVGFFVMIILCLLANPISNLMKNPDGVYALMALSPAVMVTSILVCYRGYFQGKGLMTSIGVSQIIEQLINVIVSLVFAKLLLNISLKFGIAGATLGTVVGAIISILYLFFIYEKKHLNSISKENIDTPSLPVKTIIKTLIMYATPLALSCGLQNLGIVIDTMTIRWRLAYGGFTYEETNTLVSYMGQYRTLVFVPLIVITSIGIVIIPAISRLVKLKNTHGIFYKAKLGLRMGYLVTIPSAIGLAVLSYNIYSILFFRDPNGYKLMILGSFLVVLMGCVQIQTNILQALNRFYVVIFSLSLSVIVKFIVNYILIGFPSINIYGAIMGGIISFIPPLVINTYLLKKELKEPMHLFKFVLKIILASIIMGLFLYVLNTLLLTFASKNFLTMVFITVIEILLGGAIYIFTAIKFGAITTEDLSFLPIKIQTILNKIFRINLHTSME
ncbi:MAG: putative polysaccharide biosynthesis protein [Sarcina sp.]